jgi:hypothetical protein
MNNTERAEPKCGCVIQSTTSPKWTGLVSSKVLQFAVRDEDSLFTIVHRLTD